MLVKQCYKAPILGGTIIMFQFLLNMAIKIVDLPINSMVMFHSFWYVYQRVQADALSYPIHPVVTPSARHTELPQGRQ